jgi:PAS domain S-box-containing protein
MSKDPQPSKNNIFSTRNQSETTFRHFLEVLPDAVVVVDTTGNIQFTNTQAQKIFGYDPDELLGKPVELLIPSRYNNHSSQRDAYFANPYTRPMGIDMELVAQRKERVEFPVEIALSPLETVEGTFVIAIIRDVGLRKSTEQALRRNEARNRALLDAIPDLMFRVHRDGMIWDFKADDPKDLFAPPETFLGEKLSKVLPDAVAQQAMEAIGWAAETGKRQALEYTLPLEDGLRYFEAWVAPSSPDEFVFINRDVTDRKQSDERFRNTLDNMLEGARSSTSTGAMYI